MKEKEYKKYILTFSKEAENDLTKLTAISDNKRNIDTIKEAISLFRIVILNQIKGGKLILEDNKGELRYVTKLK